MIDFKKSPLFFIDEPSYFSQEEIDKFINNITKYTNIDYSMTCWPIYNHSVYNNENLIKHLADNIIDINAKEYSGAVVSFTLLEKLGSSSPINLAYYIIDCGCNLHSNLHVNYINYNKILKFKKLQQFIYKNCIFKNNDFIFKNTCKYYNTMPIMLLIMKSQKILPKTIIKYKIIPFIYS